MRVGSRSVDQSVGRFVAERVVECEHVEEPNERLMDAYPVRLTLSLGCHDEVGPVQGSE